MAKSTKVTPLHPNPTAVASRVSLCCHAAHPCPAVSACEVSVTWNKDGLDLSYRFAGDLSALRLPEPQIQAGFTDGLWQHTCLEAFIAPGNAPAYREFNFSPSGNWAAYAFQTYRQRDPSWQPTTAPSLKWLAGGSQAQLSAHIPARLLPAGNTLRLGLSAVIEMADGSLSYWALRHAGATPDFHHSAGFSLTLTTPPDPVS